MKLPRSAVWIALLVLFLGSMSMIILQTVQHQTGDAALQDALLLAKTSAQPAAETPAPSVQVLNIPLLGVRGIPDAAADSLAQIELAPLRHQNPDILGWISIPGTNISYPLLQGEDNDYYLNNTWDHRPSYQGSIFMECKNNANLEDFNTILYGHNLLDGTMFSQLHFYKDETFLRENPFIYLVTKTGILRYRIYAVYETPIDRITYRLRFDDSQKQAFLENGLSRSLYDTGVTPTTGDSILTLSTCTGVIRTNRWVVQAVLEGIVVSPGDLKDPGITTALTIIN